MTVIRNELLDQLLVDYKKPEDLIGETGLLKQLTKAIYERAMEAEMTQHLGHARHDPVTNESGNARNGKSRKTIKGDFGELPLDIPRDRQGTFEPLLVPKHERRFRGFDEKILSLYARGLTVREIQGHLEEIYGVDVSPSLVSSVTEAVLEEVKAWQSRPLDRIYPIVYLDCIHVKVRDHGSIQTKAVYLVIGVSLAGEKEVLGLWIAQAEGAKFWLQVVTELKNRGVQDIFIACVDGLKGFPEAIESVFPKATVQLCVVHLVRYCMNFVSWKDRKAVAADLRRIYQKLCNTYPAKPTWVTRELSQPPLEHKVTTMTNQILQPNNNNSQTQTHTPRLLVAMEMSLKKWGVALAVEGQPRKRVKTVEGGDYLTLLKAVEEAKQRFGLSADTLVVFCYEAGRDGFFPYRRLVELGHEVWVVDSASIEVSRRRRQAKSDGVDLDKLMELMQRRARGELKALRFVRVPSQEAEDQRALPRERESLMHDAQQLRNRIESALFTQGYRDVPKTAKGLRAWMESPTVALGEQLRERLCRDILGDAGSARTSDGGGGRGQSLDATVRHRLDWRLGVGQ
jgi:transposase-like protein